MLENPNSLGELTALPRSPSCCGGQLSAPLPKNPTLVSALWVLSFGPCFYESQGLTHYRVAKPMPLGLGTGITDRVSISTGTLDTSINICVKVFLLSITVQQVPTIKVGLDLVTCGLVNITIPLN